MINLRTLKILRDLAANKARVLFVVISIAVGLFAMSTVFRSQAILARDLNESFAAINPASATLFTNLIDEDLVTTIANMPQVAEAQGQRTVWSRIQVGPQQWLSLKLVALADYDDIRVNQVVPAAGAWPPPERGLLLERSSLAAARARLGQTVIIEAPNGRQRELEVAGLAHDLTVVSGELLDQVIFGYITLDTLESLGLTRDFNELNLVVSGDRFDQTTIRRVADQAADRLEQEGHTVFGTEIPEPGKHQMDSVIQSLLLILGSLGALSLILTGFLLYNTLSALLTRQIPQIGVMKTIGAPKRDILAMYAGNVVIFGLLALFISVPLGILGAHLLTVQLAGLLNFDIRSFRVPWTITGLEFLTGLIVPISAALYPILNSTRITVREAIGGQGGAAVQFGTSALDQLATRLRGLPAALLYAARNIIRRKARLVLTLTTLSMGGAIFITVLRYGPRCF